MHATGVRVQIYMHECAGADVQQVWMPRLLKDNAKLEPFAYFAFPPVLFALIY